MNKAKVVRDIVLVVAIIIVAVFIFKNKSTGPAEPNGEIGGGNLHETEHIMPEMVHSGQTPARTEGNPVLTLGDSWVGLEWLDVTSGNNRLKLLADGFDDETASQVAVNQALLEGAFELVFEQAVENFDITVDPGDLEEREALFLEAFESEEEALSLLDEMGKTLDQLRNLWMEELTEKALIARIAEINSLDPDSDEAQTAYDDWIWQKILDTDFIFADPEQVDGFKVFARETYDAIMTSGEYVDSTDPHEGH